MLGIFADITLGGCLRSGWCGVGDIGRQVCDYIENSGMRFTIGFAVTDNPHLEEKYLLQQSH